MKKIFKVFFFHVSFSSIIWCFFFGYANAHYLVAKNVQSRESSRVLVIDVFLRISDFRGNNPDGLNFQGFFMNIVYTK